MLFIATTVVLSVISYFVNQKIVDTEIEKDLYKLNYNIALQKDELLKSILLEDSETLKYYLERIKYEEQLLDILVIDGEHKTICSPWITAGAHTYCKSDSNLYTKSKIEYESISKCLIKIRHLENQFSNSVYPFLISVILIIFFSYFVAFKILNSFFKGNLLKSFEMIGEVLSGDKSLSGQSKITEFNDVHKRAQELVSNYKSNIEAEKVSSIATQVAHDIRSPLAALKSSEEALSEINEIDRNAIKLAVNRIEEIAYNLLKLQDNKHNHKTKTSNILSCIDQIRVETQLKYKLKKNLTIKIVDPKSIMGSFVSIPPDKLKRILSNAITNSAESLNFDGIVKVSFNRRHESITILVEDNGKGFPDHIISNPFRAGVTTKDNGHGLGLSYINNEISKFNGSVSISNNNGAQVELTLKIAKKPEYFIEDINLSNYENIIVLDDDISVHSIWKKRLHNFSINTEYFTCATELLSKYKKLPPKTLLLTDYELLGQGLSGIDCINRLNSSNDSILVTARSNDKLVKDLIEEFHINLIPKEQISYVNIVNDGPAKYVLIDNDELVRLNWKRTFEKKEENLDVYDSVADFLKKSGAYTSDIKVYVDSDLGNGLKGEVLSEEIFELGFKNINLTTGYNVNKDDIPSWITSIIEKSPESCFS
jgi:signal transduction histidine kinase/FixJ family two-component response regulator